MSTRFADRINEEITGDCPRCGWGMPGPHDEGCATRDKCAVRLAALEVERVIRTREGRAAVLKLMRALNPVATLHPVVVGSVFTHPLQGDPKGRFAPMKVKKVFSPTTFLMDDDCEWELSGLTACGWSCP